MRTAFITLLAAAAASPALAQVSCGGTTYTVGSTQFSQTCNQTLQNCVKEFAADASNGNCQSAASDLYMQQQPSNGNNSLVTTAFNDILESCLLNGSTTATWYLDGQWYWAAAESACYNFSMPGIPNDRTTPAQQRLTVHAENAVSVAWNTYEKINQPCVQYGLLPELLLWTECSDSSITYPTSRTYSNVVTISNLLPAVTYYYKIVSTNSSVEQFMSPRITGDRTPFTFAAVIDLGVYGADGFTLPSGDYKRGEPLPQIQPELNHTTIWQLSQSVDDYEFILHPGDFAYADNFADVFSLESNPANGYETILEQFYEQLAPISGRKLYMAGPGNHDADCTESDPAATCPVGQMNFTDYINRWGRMTPTVFPTLSWFPTSLTNTEQATKLAQTPFWYSFNYGMVHFIMINTETDFDNAPDEDLGGPFGFPNQQLEFIKADLASVDRTITPWVVLGGHRTWYSIGGSGNICSPCQAAFEDLLYTYGVDLAIFGHVHNSQRFLPVYNSTADPNGMNDPKSPMYIVAGGAGNIEGLVAVTQNVTFNQFAYADDFSFATISFLDTNHLKVDFIRSATGEVLDSSVLYKSHKDQFVVQQLPQ